MEALDLFKGVIAKGIGDGFMADGDGDVWIRVCSLHLLFSFFGLAGRRSKVLPGI